jgi:putative transposase
MQARLVPKLPEGGRWLLHLTLKREATKPASPNFLQQQARFDAFLTRYNDEPAAPRVGDARAGR